MQTKLKVSSSKKPEDNNKLRLVISTDILIIPLADEITCLEQLDVLLPGENKQCYIVEGESDDIFHVIDLCYKARESAIVVDLEFDVATIPFK